MRLHEDRFTNFCERYFYEYLYNFYADMLYTIFVVLQKKILKDKCRKIMNHSIREKFFAIYLITT